MDVGMGVTRGRLRDGDSGWEGGGDLDGLVSLLSSTQPSARPLIRPVTHQ
jgi:hypothetical protein